jgi:two-component system NarL family sensor kinase
MTWRSTRTPRYAWCLMTTETLVDTKKTSRSVAVATWVVWLIALLEAGLIGFAPLLFRRQFAESGTGVDLEFVAFVVTIALVVMVFATAGAMVARGQPANLVGWLMLAGAPALGGVFLGFLIGVVLTDSDPGMARWFVLAGVVLFGPALFVLGPALAAVFPTGHLLPGWWARATWLVAIAIGIGALLAVVTPGRLEESIALDNPLGISGLPPDLRAIGSSLTALGLAVGALVGVASLVVRYRRSAVDVRHQLKWFLYAGVVLAVVMPISLAVGENWTAIVAMLALGLVPISVVVSVLRYRLYEIDTLINRTLVYVSLVGIVAGIYAGLVALLQRAFTALTGDTSDAAAVISALALATVFTPIRNALQAAVDRRFKPAEAAPSKWDDPEFRAAVEAIARDVVKQARH